MISYLLVFLSGFAALIYQVLWMNQLGLLFGNTSHAAGATLAAFFAGLAAGSWFWGKRSEKLKNPLRTFGWLEAGIAVTGLLYFVILALYFRVYPLVYQNVGSAAILLAIKFVLALLLIFPPAFCMGGTIPVIGQYLIRNPLAFGKTSALLYAVNTLGAALGAMLAGFYLPLWLGFRLTCAVAMLTTMLVSAIAWIVSLKDQSASPKAEENETDKPASQGKSKKKGKKKDKEKVPAETSTDGRWAVNMVCFVSGFGVLVLEVLWTRMFVQVVENSVYTFSAILVIVLVCLAAGAFLSSLLARLKTPPVFVLMLLLLIGGISVMTTPFVFMKLTNSMEIIASKGNWSSYVFLIFRTGALALGPPALLLGMVFPYLMKTEERYARSAGLSLGRLSAVNTVGAILGSVLCGFVFLEAWGMWRTMQLVAILYFVVALILPVAKKGENIAVKVVTVLCLLLLLGPMNPADLPIFSIDKNRMQEKVLKVYEGSGCTVAVTEGANGLSIKINSHYGLGSTGAMMQERMQSDIPLLAYPETESIFFLGMGTGITAGASLDDSRFTKVNRVVTCELVSEVVDAAEKYITNYRNYDYTNGLFEDPRSEVLAEDGRHYLMATNNQFDMINGDLFVPFRGGVGSLYSVEHFETVKKRLKPGGVFVQWLPLYQLTEYEFKIICRTMVEAFDQVSLWRSNFQPADEVVALVGHEGGKPLPATKVDAGEARSYTVAGKEYTDLMNLRLPLDSQSVLFFYCGNMTAAKSLVEEYPLNTDDKPLIEYMSPRSYRNNKETALPWFVGPRIIYFIEEVQKLCPPDKDPLLVNRSAAGRRLPLAGTAYHWARVYQTMPEAHEQSKTSWDEFVHHWLNQPSASE